jgi:hypothetical protein
MTSAAAAAIAIRFIEKLSLDDSSFFATRVFPSASSVHGRVATRQSTIGKGVSSAPRSQADLDGAQAAVSSAPQLAALSPTLLRGAAPDAAMGPAGFQ